MDPAAKVPEELASLLLIEFAGVLFNLAYNDEAERRFMEESSEWQT